LTTLIKHGGGNNTADGGETTGAEPVKKGTGGWPRYFILRKRREIENADAFAHI
jgi:hypothetical protein